MAFGINLSKEDIIRIFAVLVVVAFVFEIIAFNQPQNVNRGSASGTSTNATGSNLDNFQGNAVGNITVVSWDPALIVLNENEITLKEIEAMKAEGLVAYSSNTSQGLILTLAQKKAFAEVAARIYATNATALADTAGSVSGAKVQGDGFVRSAQGGTFTFRLPPLFEQGDVFEAVFPALVQNGKIVAVGNAEPTVQPSVSALFAPEKMNVSSRYYVLQVPWELRNSVNSTELSAALGGANVSVKKRSMIQFDSSTSQEKIAALSSNLPSYALSFQQNSISVPGGFVDRQKAEDDLYSRGVKAVFPNSTVQISGVKGMEPNLTLIAQEAAKYGMGNATITPAYVIAVTLPKKIDVEGKNYTTVLRELEFPSQSEPIDGAMIGIVFTPYGRAIDTIEKIQLFNPQIYNFNQTTDINGNETNVTAPEQPNVNATANASAAVVANATGAPSQSNATAISPNNKTTANATSNATAIPVANKSTNATQATGANSSNATLAK